MIDTLITKQETSDTKEKIFILHLLVLGTQQSYTHCFMYRMLTMTLWGHTDNQ